MSTVIRDNPFQPGMKSYTYQPDQLISDARNLVTQPILVVGGVYKRGTVLGQQTAYPTQAIAGLTNVGNGPLESIKTGAPALIGSYILTAKSAAKFSVTTPAGEELAEATVGAAYVSSQIGFTITAGGTAFVAGDKFTINVFNAVGTFTQCVRTANDGSQNPSVVLADDVDASLGPVTAGGYLAGEFNASALLYDASWNLSLLVNAMRPFSLFAKASLSAAAPSNNSAP